MVIPAHDQTRIDEFFSDLAPLEEGHVEPTCSYLAIRRGDDWILVQGRIFLNTAIERIPFGHFSSDNVRAGHFKLSDVSLTLKAALQQLLTGKLAIPGVELVFPVQENSSYGIYHQPFHAEGLQNQNRLNVLGVTGAQIWGFMRQPHLDWELKATPTPFDSISELTAEYQCGLPRNDNIGVELIAFHIAAVDGATSTLSGEEAHINIFLAGSAKPEKLRMGYRVLQQGKVIRRDSVSGNDFTWSTKGTDRFGSLCLAVPAASLIQCLVSYAGVAQSQWWIADPTTSPNPFRAVYETFDKQLSILKDALQKEVRGRARDLEASVGWLLWMLGFSVAHLGANVRMSEAPDLIVTSPAGNFVIVECTTGTLKGDGKLSKLHERALIVRQALQASNNSHLRVLPVIVTTKTSEEIAPDLEQAERWGIHVITRENFDGVFNATLIRPQAEELYQRAEKEVQNAQAKYNTQQSLPLPPAG